ncbi:MAG: NUDIX domain-containing protein [Ardenticatenaceae bacterium]|nr:NUDIX domain-containing protein [Ardenticatenaceae bacterium]
MMPLRQRASLVIVRDEMMLLIYRYRNGRSYYILPGGGVEPGESLAEAAVREAAEETSLQVVLGPQLWQRELEEQIETAFLITQFEGTPRLGDPEFLRQSPDNLYRLEWVPFAEVNELIRYPAPVEWGAIEAALGRGAS